MRRSLLALFVLISIASLTACPTVDRDFTGGAGGEGAGGAGGMGVGGSSSTGNCKDGSAGCPCAPGNTCDAGATCINGVCKPGCCSGYNLVGNACVWGGGDKDPGFMGMGAWSTVGTAKLEAKPGVDPGRAFFDADTVCGFGGVTQTFPMPEVSCAEPLIMNFQASTTCSDPFNCNEPPVVGVGINGGWNRVLLPPPGLQDVWKPYQVCIGARALGGPAALFLGPGEKPSFCLPGMGPAIALDAVTIDIDKNNACPPLGQVPNGDFEAGAASWTLTPGTATADIKMGAGNGGSASGHLATTKFCSSPRMRGTVSIPTAAMTPNTALQIWSKVSLSAVGLVQIGPDATTFLPGGGAAKAMNICLPKWALGTVQPINFSFVETYGGQTCANPNPRDFAFDDLKFVSDPACTSDADLFDPSFEQVSLVTTAAPFWALQQYTDNTGATVSLKVDAASAHSGNVSASFVATHPCDTVYLLGSATIPSADAKGGPALKFWYKTGFQLMHAALSVSMEAIKAQSPLAISTSWKQVTVCLDPTRVTRPDVVRFRFDSGSGTCATVYTTETASVDDVVLTTDASCPSK